MDSKHLLSRLHEIEVEVQNLKTHLEPPNKRGRAVLQSLNFVKEYWFLFTFLFALISAIYVWYKFRTNYYFQSFADISETRNLSEYYFNLGEKMIAHSNWEEANKAFQQALVIRPNYYKASFRLAQTKIFLPDSDFSYKTLKTADIQLDFLEKIDSTDYINYFLKGIRSLEASDTTKAIEYFTTSIKKNPEFSGNYIQLGYSYLSYDLKKAIQNFKDAYFHDPDSLTNTEVREYLAWAYSLEGNFKKAIEILQITYNRYPGSYTAGYLAENFRYTERVDSALFYDLSAYMHLQKEKSSANAMTWVYTYMPDSQNKKLTKLDVLNFGTLLQKEAFLRFSLACDYALLGAFQNADKNIEAGIDLVCSDTVTPYYSIEYCSFVNNRLISLHNHVNSNENVKTWLKKAENLVNYRINAHIENLE